MTTGSFIFWMCIVALIWFAFGYLRGRESTLNTLASPDTQEAGYEQGYEDALEDIEAKNFHNQAARQTFNRVSKEEDSGFPIPDDLKPKEDLNLEED